MEPTSLEERSARYEELEPVFLAELDNSLGPSGSDILYDLVGELHLAGGALILDAGCGKGRQLVELARRFNVRMIGIDPAPIHLEMAAQAIAEADSLSHGLAARVRTQLGRVEALPLQNGSIDLVWCRDVLPLVADPFAAYSEFARVLRPGGKAIVYQSSMAPDFTEREAERFWAPLEAVSTSSEPALVEAAIAASGLELDRWFQVALEWSEYSAETNGTGPRRLLHLARLLRQPGRYIERFGRWAYDMMLADCYWHVFRMMGKIDERVYLLTKPA